jgi:hypothetical protein
MRTHTLLGATLILCGGIVVAGCGGGGCAVQGKVLLDGEPVSEGRIALRPKQPGPNARTVQAVVSEGQFQFIPAQGVVPGAYSVVITARRKTGQQLPPEEGSGEVLDRYEQYLPPKYNTRTELTADISGGTNDLLFELELPQGARRKR